MEKNSKAYYKYCIVPMCKNNIITAPDKFYFHMPRDTNVRKEWCKAMRRDNNISCLSSLYCCEDHFNKKDELCPPPERQAALNRKHPALVYEALAAAARTEDALSVANLSEAGPSMASISQADLSQAGPSTASVSQADLSQTVAFKQQNFKTMLGVMVKTESGSATCRGCLSTDRRLSPLINYILYFSLLSDKQKLEVMMESEILMCWECNALMRKMMAFQTQAQEAHTVLENCTENATTKTSLSHLTVCHNQNYDVIIEETTDGLTNELSDCDLLDAEDVKEEIDGTIEHKIDEENVINMDIASEHFDADEDESCIEETDNLSFEQDNASNCVIKTKIKVKKLMVPVRERLQRTAKQKKPKPRAKKRKRKTKKIITSKKTKAVVRIPIQNAQTPVKIDNNVKVAEVSEGVSGDEDNQNLDPDFEMESAEVTDKSGPSTAVKGNHNNVKIDEEVCETESDDEDNQNSDPDFEIESPKVTDKSGQPKVKRKHKYKLCYKKKEDFDSVMCRTERFKYSFRDLDTFFTELKLSEEEVASALEKQPSYKTEECKYECHYCGLCFTFKYTLEKHSRLCHKELLKSLRCRDPSSPWFYRYRMYRCSACRAVLRSEHAAAHMKYSHVWRFFCSQCREVFWNKDEMKAHWKSSHWPYACDNCDATLTSKWLLVKHMWEHHRASKPFRCEECGGRFVSQYNLQKHRRRKHSREDSAPELRYCVPCDKRFATIRLYQEHLKISKAHNVKKTYPCPACDKVLCSQSSLKQHYSYFHTDSALFPCPHCHKDNRTLRHHILTHTGERPHACALCPAAFTQKHSLRMHMAARHNDQPAAADTQP